MHIIFYNLCIFWKEYTYFENSNFRNISVNFQIELISSRFMLRCLKCNHLAMWSSGRNSSQNHIVSGVVAQEYCIKLTQQAKCRQHLVHRVTNHVCLNLTESSVTWSQSPGPEVLDHSATLSLAMTLSSNLTMNVVPYFFLTSIGLLKINVGKYA